jgi:SpoVK/Ycf46/Vps4 family AAA+-type ATPase
MKKELKEDDDVIKICRKKMRLKKKYSNVKPRIDTGLARPRKPKTPIVLRKDLPPLACLSDLCVIGNKISNGERFKRINNSALCRSYVFIEQLNMLIGLTELKRTVFDQIIYFLLGLDKITKDDFLHTVLIGPPGTGKTTVARILGQIYSALGVIKDNKNVFKIAHREDLVASYLGQTATKTLDLLQSCVGGVLFIDEVYALGSGVEGKDSFSKEAVDTLCGFLSENADRFVCIVAGYEEDVERCFFRLNKGLKSRFNWVHSLTSYAPSEMCDIFFAQVKSIGWCIRASDKEEIRENIKKESSIFDQGQGRAIKNFVFKCKIAHSKRLLYSPDCAPGEITAQDVDDAIQLVLSGMKSANKKEYIGMFL